jgi:predicted nucleotidyltransferase component of viral defense system
MIQPQYRAQVNLLLQILPYIAKEEIFALKGGTAINLFVRDLPRLSVDIDLTYFPIDSRPTALRNIQEGLGRIKNAIERAIVGLNVNTVASNDGMDVKLNCQFPNAQIKIEVNTTTRGHLLPVRLMSITDKVQDEFGKFAAINVVSHAELFGGKICAALDRQHPRDLFDVNLLFEKEGFTEDIKLGLMAALFSHYKPIHELINPLLKDQKSAFDSQFSGMTNIPFLYEDYVTTRSELIKKLNKLFTENDKKLILSFERGNPDWSLFPIPIIKDLPAVNCKLLNIHKLINENPDKHTSIFNKLVAALY